MRILSSSELLVDTRCRLFTGNDDVGEICRLCGWKTFLEPRALNGWNARQVTKNIRDIAMKLSFYNNKRAKNNHLSRGNWKKIFKNEPGQKIAKKSSVS